MFLVQVGIRDVPNAVFIALLPHLQLPLFAIIAPVWTQSDCETERSMRESRRNENRNDIVYDILFNQTAKNPKRECQIRHYGNFEFQFKTRNLFHGIPYIDKILIQKQWNDFVFYNNI